MKVAQNCNINVFRIIVERISSNPSPSLEKIIGPKIDRQKFLEISDFKEMEIRAIKKLKLFNCPNQLLNNILKIFT